MWAINLKQSLIHSQCFISHFPPAWGSSGACPLAGGLYEGPARRDQGADAAGFTYLPSTWGHILTIKLVLPFMRLLTQNVFTLVPIRASLRSHETPPALPSEVTLHYRGAPGPGLCGALTDPWQGRGPVRSTTLEGPAASQLGAHRVPAARERWYSVCGPGTGTEPRWASRRHYGPATFPQPAWRTAHAQARALPSRACAGRGFPRAFPAS